MSNSTFPSRLVSGDSFTWTYADSKYPASLYTLNVYFRGPTSITFTATALNGGYVLTVGTSQATYKAGTYNVSVVASNQTERVVLFQQAVEVLPDPIADTKKDQRTFNARMLDAVEALIERRASAGQIDIIKTEIKDRSVETLKHTELLALRDRYKTKVLQEQGRLPKTIQFYFEPR
jgi:hypothetical protein